METRGEWIVWGLFVSLALVFAGGLLVWGQPTERPTWDAGPVEVVMPVDGPASFKQVEPVGPAVPVETADQTDAIKQPGTAIEVCLFTAGWCPACRKFKPTFSRWYRDFERPARAGETFSLTFRQVDADERPGLIGQHRIAALPTVIVFVNGKEVKRFEGEITRDQLFDALKPYWPSV